MDFLDRELQKYVETHSMEEDDLLRRIDRETHLNVMKPRMLSGHLQGRILSIFSHMIKPTYILEVGTFTGYSALCLAEGMNKEGKLVTIDINEELTDRVSGYFDESSFKGCLEIKVGSADKIIPQLDYPWDLIFVDADKINYQCYYDLLIDQLNPGAFLIFDNVLWSGKVLEKNRKKLDKVTAALIDFNRAMQEDERVENVLFPLRDGLMVLRKK